MFVDDTVLASAFYRKHAPAGLEAMIAGIPKPQRQALHIPAHASCAVVGNSGNLRQSGYGPRIDAHPVVFRMNQAPTKPFEADVGRRTTVRYTALHHVAALKVEPDVDLIVSGELNRFNMFAAQALPRLGDFHSVHIINKRFTDEVRTFTTHHTSSGIELVFLAIGLCQSVDVYGFGHQAPGLWDHYFSSAVTNLNLQAYPHDSNNEAATLRALDRLSYVRLFGGVR
ncbi:MAG: glycosyltransferase family 29 protein, partial [Cyanobacteria bacterium HKST-UBA05]|nr:glycosyltransferase family 29 protein [Cyanobacteria bacterium HKST-UBA05]